MMLCYAVRYHQKNLNKYKKGSNEKGKKWTEIAEALNKSEEDKFKVTQRAVRERMEKKHLERKKEEESTSGIAVDDVTELETLIDEQIEESWQKNPEILREPK